MAVSPRVGEYISHLAPEIKKHIRDGLDEIGKDPFCGKPLQKEFEGFCTYRVVRHRIIYKILPDEKIIEIHSVGPRETVYEDFDPLQGGW